MLDPVDENNIFWLGSYSIGYLRELVKDKGLDVGLGGMMTINSNPASLTAYYGGNNPFRMAGLPSLLSLENTALRFFGPSMHLKWEIQVQLLALLGPNLDKIDERLKVVFFQSALREFHSSLP